MPGLLHPPAASAPSGGRARPPPDREGGWARPIRVATPLAQRRPPAYPSHQYRRQVLGESEQRSTLEDLRIERLAAGGDGVGRLASGLAVFVPFTAPGDVVRVRVTETRRRFARAEVVKLIESGPARRPPACPVFGVCGGCTWQHIDYPAQLEAKRAILIDALARIGGIRPPSEPEVVPSPEPYGYRSRARLLVQEGRVGYRERRSHRLCAVTACPVLAPALEAELGRLGESVAAGAGAAAPHAEDGEWELALGSEGEVRSGPLGTSPRSPGCADPPASVGVQAGDEVISISPGTFAQSNGLLLEVLWRAAQAAVGEGEALLELYAGAGFFSLGFARRFRRLRVVESSASAVADLRRNLAAAGLGAVEIDARPVEQVLARRLPLRPDVVFLDPPRTGLGPGLARPLASLGAERVVYLSCDPATLARDLAQLVEAGYGVESVRAFDLFPQTAHLEALAVLVLR